ncbi:MAG TPA: hypothetical protein PLP33_25305 [Leptospiraceae bacterium]|nr:hypothetical protein [Leptospiraceae bacterium]
MESTFQSERLGITIKMHGEAVWNNTKDLILGKFARFRLPDWFIKNHHNIINSLHSWEDIRFYTLYHDVGKGLVKTVDEQGSIHFPNHEKKSKEIFQKYFPAFPEAAELIGLDMLMHISNPTQIAESNLPTKTLLTLLFVAFAEIHANAEMFGGTESTSFKIKYKNLDRIGKNLVKRVEKDNNSYMYVFVRKDLESGSHKAVQAGHAVFEQAKQRNEHPSFVYLGVEDEEQLKMVMELLLDNNIQFKIFREPMVPYCGQVTSIATEPLVGEERNLLRQFPLLKI